MIHRLSLALVAEDQAAQQIGDDEVVLDGWINGEVSGHISGSNGASANFQSLEWTAGLIVLC